MRYVALLRGINVGGNTMIKMEELRNTFEALGLENVVSYINSGNLAFDCEDAHLCKGESFLILKIEKAIEAEFSKQITVMIRKQSDVRGLLTSNPFEGEFDDHRHMHVLFMKDEMPEDKQALLVSNNNDTERFAVRGREIFCHLKRGVADSLLGKGYIEKKLRVPVTGRNWRTVQKLTEL